MPHSDQTIGGPIAALILALMLANAGGAQIAPLAPARQGADALAQNFLPPFTWKSAVRLRHGIGSTPGTLSADSRSINFVPANGPGKRWPFSEIMTLDLGRHRVILTGYESRRWHLPMLRRFDFTLEQDLAPAVAESLAKQVSKPIQNRIPDPEAPATAVIAVRRSDHFGGSNGLLRIRQQGMDYVTDQAGQSRSWRWTDLQTLSHPDPYHLFVFGYRESYSFALKGTLSRERFNHISDEIWTHNQSDMTGSSAGSPLAVPEQDATGQR